MSSPISYTKHKVLNLLANAALTAVGVILAAHTSDSIYYRDDASLIAAAFVLMLLNVILRPILTFLALPFIMLTLGLGTWVINALLFKWVGNFVEGFYVATWGGAFWGAFMVSLTTMLSNWSAGREKYVVDSNTPSERIRRHHRRKEEDDVIDI